MSLSFSAAQLVISLLVFAMAFVFAQFFKSHTGEAEEDNAANIDQRIKALIDERLSLMEADALTVDIGDSGDTKVETAADTEPSAAVPSNTVVETVEAGDEMRVPLSPRNKIESNTAQAIEMAE